MAILYIKEFETSPRKSNKKETTKKSTQTTTDMLVRTNQKVVDKEVSLDQILDVFNNF